MQSKNILPSKKLKIFFWVILGAFSVFFAEVISGSDMFPFFHIWGLFVVFPLYTLHILVLAYIVFNHGKPRLYTLFIAGALFGMYEAYITKVLWAPFWGEPLFSLAGIAVIETIVLVLFWHPFMAFIVPLFASENVLTNSREIMKGLPNRIKQLFNSKKKIYVVVILFALFSGIFQGFNSASPTHSLLSGFSTTGVLLLLIYLWRNKTKGKEYDIKSLLPNKKEFLVLLSLLLVMYVVLGIYLSPEALPGLLPQLIIWLIYMGLFILLFFSLKKSRKKTMISPKRIDLSLKLSWKIIIALILLFVFSSAIAKILIIEPLTTITMLVFWASFCIIGILVLLLSIKDLFHKRDTE